MNPQRTNRAAAIIIGFAALSVLTVLLENDIRIWAWLTGS